MFPPEANPTSSSLYQAVVGLIGFAPYILPSGFLSLRLVRGADTLRLSRAEQVLWSTALGLPAAVLLIESGRRFLSVSALNVVFAALALAAAAFWFRDLRKSRAAAPGRPDERRPTRSMLWIAAAFAVYCIAQTADIQIGSRIYVTTVLPDWSVRVSMVNAAMHSGVPPLNRLSTLSVKGLGFAPPLRYYYFWYVAAAQVARTFHVAAQPILTASCVWALWGLLATAFLTLKYTIGIRDRLRSKCVLFVGVLAIHGLDLLPTLWLWFSRTHHPYPEMEWWRQDRTPSFFGVVYAPHHVAAWCALLAAFLLFQTLAFDPARISDSSRRRRAVFTSLFAGGGFAATSGLSLFPAFVFVFVFCFWSVDLLRRRDWLTVGSLAAAGVLSLLIARPYLRELSSGSSAAGGFVNLAWRNDAFVAMEYARFHWFAGHGAIGAFLTRQPLVLLLDFFEIGFYLFILVHVVRRELLSKERLSPGLCAWWALLLGAAVPALLMTSTATSGPNDLGVDAASLFRLALQFRAVEWIWDGWHQRRRLAAEHPLLFSTAVLLAGLGIGAQVYQILGIRLYFPVVASGFGNKQIDALTKDHLAERLFNIRSALQQFDAQVPPSQPDTEAIQFNPVGQMMPAEVYFSDHQVASWDTGCGTSYGGEAQECHPIYESLLFLFGNTDAGVLQGRAQNDRQDGAAPRVASAEDLAAVCQHLRLRAVVVESTDSIWSKPDSWVWSATPLVANSTVRIIGCPTGSWRP